MIYLYRGARGKGKTLTMVKDAYKFFLLGWKIYANFKLLFGDKISSEEVLALNKTSSLKNCVLVIDEIELFFDSRSWSKVESKTFSNFLQQLRKRNVIILCTAQYTNLIDIRIRQQLDKMIFPNFNIKNNLCDCKYFDLTVMENFNFKVFVPTLVVYDAKPIFSLYDTYELLA